MVATYFTYLRIGQEFEFQGEVYRKADEAGATDSHGIFVQFDCDAEVMAAVF